MNYPEIFNIKQKTKTGFPSLGELSESIAIVLNNEKLHPRIKQQVLDGALWWAADYAGKGFNCPFRSEAAEKTCKQLQRDGKPITKQGLIHDHIIPKKLLREALGALDKPVQPNAVLPYLKLSIYCLITEKDNKQLKRQAMPEGNDNWKPPRATANDIWARYKTKNINVVVL
ncbi:MAG: hypothetical protein PXX77_01935 [Gallionella sp.]|nr:hypothetical protein [Gallionella sp.]